MNSPIGKHNYDQFWTVVDTPAKLELLSYLILCLRYPQFDIYKTPKTRDNKRDAEGVFRGEKIFAESKFIVDVLNKKLSHKEVGSNINIAIYELADALLIFTNGFIQLDLANFIALHNEIHESILNRPLRIMSLNRKQIAMYALKFTGEQYLHKLSQLKLKGYKNKNIDLLKVRTEELKQTGKEIISNLQKIKEDTANFYIPTLANVFSSDWKIEEKENFIRELVQIEVYYQFGTDDAYKEKIKIALGTSFYIVIRINNFFFDDIDFTVDIKPIGLVKFIGPILQEHGKFYFNSSINGLSEKIIKIESRIERLPFNGITSRLQIGEFSLPLFLNKIDVENLFFLAPFVGETNNSNLSLYKEKIDRVVYEKKFFCALITGEAGVGKSRFIQEIVDHAKQYKAKIFRTELIASEGRRTFIRDVISFFTGIDSSSFTTYDEQLLIRFKDDQNFAALFADNREFESFRVSVASAMNTGVEALDTLQQIKISDFIVQILLHLGASRLTVIIVEDLHHADKAIFSFLLRLYNILKTKKCRVSFLFAGRTEAKDMTQAFHEFDTLISSDSTYSITKTQIYPLSDQDSLSLLKELVTTESKFEKSIEETVLHKTGNNPFNIIHTLLHLKNLGIIVEKHHEFEWRNISKLHTITLHAEIEKILVDRFTFYLNNLEEKAQVISLLTLISLFESRISIETFSQVWHAPDPSETVSFLARERIIRVAGGYLLLDHENILQYVKAHILPIGEVAAKMIIDWIKSSKSEKANAALLIRCYEVCFVDYKKEFFSHIIKYLNGAIKMDDWEQAIRYGQMFLDKADGNKTYYSEIDKYKIEFSLASIKSEYGDLNAAIKSYEDLEGALSLKVGSKALLTFRRLPYHLLLLKTRLYRCDAIIMSSQYLKAQLILKVLIKEISEIRLQSKCYQDHLELLEILCWAQNRLGITERALGNVKSAYSIMTKSLMLAKQIEHEYYIHHNYYDMAGCLVHMDKLDKAIEIHKKGIRPILDFAKYTNARIRTQIRTGVFHVLQNLFDKAEVEFEQAIMQAKEGNYLWELTRALINQAASYLQQKKIALANESFKTAIHFIDIHNAQSFYFCLYNNLAFLQLHEYEQSKDIYKLEESINSFLKSITSLPAHLNNIEKGQMSSHDIFSAVNSFKYLSVVTAMDINNHKRNDFLVTFESLHNRLRLLMKNIHKPNYMRKFHVVLSKDIEFYATYMSFS